jgi:lipoate-protein ligase A
MPPSLRFIVDFNRPARFNMAADLFTMQYCRNQPVITVRFYTWSPAAVTLGRMQRPGEQLDAGALLRDGIEWIRRPTGGRAVLHQEDLTYSCIFPRSITALGTNVAETYATITRCLECGLSKCGISTTAENSTSPLIKSARTVKLPCFLAPNRNEIMVGGRKLIGSAQYRSSSAVLQHGSLPLTSAYRNLPRYMPLSTEERHKLVTLLEQKSLSLEEVSPALSVEDLLCSLIDGFSDTLRFPYSRSNWSGEETKAIANMADSAVFATQWLSDVPSAAPFR